MKTKVCINCNFEKQLNEFPKRKDSLDGHRNDCRDCNNKIKIKWEKENIDKVKKCKKTYWENNKDDINKKQKERRKNNPDYSKNYYKNNKERIRTYNKKYRKNNREEIKQKKKNYYQNNKEEIKMSVIKYAQNNKEETNKRQKKRRKIDINYRVSHNLRSRLNKALRGNPKFNTTMKLVGCTIGFLIKYIEKQFTSEMNWDNYGKYWEIDHIIPCSLFDFTRETEQRKCFHYSNLQPLTCKDNREKHNKLKSNNTEIVLNDPLDFMVVEDL